MFPPARSMLRLGATALCSTLAGTAALAQAAPEQVTTSGLRPMTDVRSACPDIDDELQQVLWKLVRDRGESGLAEVRFQLDGQRIGQVQVDGAPTGYRAGIRRAVRMLSCDTPDRAPRVAHLRLRFVAGSGDTATALVQVDPAPNQPR